MSPLVILLSLHGLVAMAAAEVCLEVSGVSEVNGIYRQDDTLPMCFRTYPRYRLVGASNDVFIFKYEDSSWNIATCYCCYNLPLLASEHATATPDAENSWYSWNLQTYQHIPSPVEIVAVTCTADQLQHQPTIGCLEVSGAAEANGIYIMDNRLYPCGGGTLFAYRMWDAAKDVFIFKWGQDSQWKASPCYCYDCFELDDSPFLLSESSTATPDAETSWNIQNENGDVIPAATATVVAVQCPTGSFPAGCLEVSGGGEANGFYKQDNMLYPCYGYNPRYQLVDASKDVFMFKDGQDGSDGPWYVANCHCNYCDYGKKKVEYLQSVSTTAATPDAETLWEVYVNQSVGYNPSPAKVVAVPNYMCCKGALKLGSDGPNGVRHKYDTFKKQLFVDTAHPFPRSDSIVRIRFFAGATNRSDLWSPNDRTLFLGQFKIKGAYTEEGCGVFKYRTVIDEWTDSDLAVSNQGVNGDYVRDYAVGKLRMRKGWMMGHWHTNYGVISYDQLPRNPEAPKENAQYCSGQPGNKLFYGKTGTTHNLSRGDVSVVNGWAWRDYALWWYFPCEEDAPAPAPKPYFGWYGM